jgi:N-acetylneuraminic acid mutarotase
MKKIVLITLMLMVTAGIANAQYYWTQKANFGGTNRQSAVGFSVSGKGYIGSGRDINSGAIYNDFWMYDPNNNAWTQVADFGGTPRFSANFFVINDTAYVGLGNQDQSTYDFAIDFWKYNQGTNTWSQIADFGGNARYNSTSFAIGSKGYVCTGYAYSTAISQDLWEYNSLTNTWTAKANYPGGPRQAPISFTIGNYGYVGTGDENQGTLASDFYKYDPSNDSWTQIADYPIVNSSASSFVINNIGYVGTGTSSYNNTSTHINHWWSYDPSTNIWTSIADMSSTLRFNAVGFTINNIGYCGTGCFGSNWADTTDFWQYAPAREGIPTITNQINNLNVYPNPSNGQFKVNYTATENASLALKIVDIDGRIILFQNKNQVSGFNEFSFDLSKEAKGIYFVELLVGNEKSIQKLILE